MWLEILQRGFVVAPSASPERRSRPRRLAVYLPVLHSLTMDGEWKYPRFYSAEPRSKSYDPGQCRPFTPKRSEIDTGS